MAHPIKAKMASDLGLPAALQDTASRVLPEHQISPPQPTGDRTLCSIPLPWRKKLKLRKGKCIQCFVQGSEKHCIFMGQALDADHRNTPVACFQRVSEQLAWMPAQASFPGGRAVFRPQSDVAWSWGSQGLSCRQHAHRFPTMGLQRWMPSKRSSTLPKSGSPASQSACSRQESSQQGVGYVLRTHFIGRNHFCRRIHFWVAIGVMVLRMRNLGLSLSGTTGTQR